MRILLLGDYSNYHATLAIGLRRLGHQVTVASDGTGWMNTDRNINLSRPLPGKAGGMALYCKLLYDSRLRGYDIVSLINPSFTRLQPHRLKRIFNRLRRSNGNIFLAAVGTDKAYMDMMVADDCPLRYTEYKLPDGTPNISTAEVFSQNLKWREGAVSELCEYVYDNVDGVTTALYEYHLAMLRRFDADNVEYVGIPIDTCSIKPVDRPLLSSGKVNLFLGRHSHRKAFKGTDIMGRAAEKVFQKFPDRCSLNIVEDVPFKEYVKLLSNADLVLDQLYSYTPATNALLAMAAGQAVLSGGEPEFYEFINEKELHPVINTQPDEKSVYDTLKKIVLNPSIVVNVGSKGREFVLKHNDCDVVASRCINFWEKQMLKS